VAVEALVVLVPVVVFGGLIALVVVLVVYGGRRERAQLEAFGQWALRNEWQFVPQPAVAWAQRLPGHNRRGVTLALFGLIGGRHTAIGEYQYTTTSTSQMGEQTTTSTQTHRYVVMVTWLSRPGPTLSVARRRALRRVGRALFGDRNTVGFEPFDSAFHVDTDDPTASRRLLGQNLVAEQVAGWLPEWSLTGNELMTVRQGRIGDPAGIPAQLAPLLRVADHLETTIGR
jgi:hypothetical protein